jgi:hypothetical protein
MVNWGFGLDTFGTTSLCAVDKLKHRHRHRGVGEKADKLIAEHGANSSSVFKKITIMEPLGAECREDLRRLKGV